MGLIMDSISLVSMSVRYLPLRYLVGTEFLCEVLNFFTKEKLNRNDANQKTEEKENGVINDNFQISDL